MVRLSRRRAGLLGCVLALGAAAAGCAADTTPPRITVYADYATTVTGPILYCGLDATRCSTGSAPRVPVPEGKPLQVSLPDAIADAPWRMITTYRTPAGAEGITQQYFRPGQRLAVTVTAPTPADQLTRVEIQLPSSVIDPQGNPIIRAAWAVRTDTAPAGS